MTEPENQNELNEELAEGGRMAESLVHHLLCMGAAKATIPVVVDGKRYVVVVEHPTPPDAQTVVARQACAESWQKFREEKEAHRKQAANPPPPSAESVARECAEEIFNFARGCVGLPSEIDALTLLIARHIAPIVQELDRYKMFWADQRSDDNEMCDGLNRVLDKAGLSVETTYEDAFMRLLAERDKLASEAELGRIYSAVCSRIAKEKYGREGLSADELIQHVIELEAEREAVRERDCCMRIINTEASELSQWKELAGEMGTKLRNIHPSDCPLVPIGFGCQCGVNSLLTRLEAMKGGKG